MSSEFNISAFKFPDLSPHGPTRTKQVAAVFKCVPSEHKQTVNELLKVKMEELHKAHPQIKKQSKKKRDVLSHNAKRFGEKFKNLHNTLLCIDIEMYERAQHRTTEFGYTLIDMDAGTLNTHHIIVTDFYKHRNRKYVPDNKDNFMYGDSIKLSLADTIAHVDKLLKKHKYIIGHSVRDDIKHLNQHFNINTDGFTLLDTANLYKVLKNIKQTPGVKRLCDEYNVELKHAHNAGNDSHSTACLFLKLYDEWKQRDNV